MPEPARWIDRLHALIGPGRSANIAQAGKWTFYFVVIGLIAGAGSILFHYLCQLGIHYFLYWMAGYRPPAPAGEHQVWLKDPATGETIGCEAELLHRPGMTEGFYLTIDDPAY